MVISFRGDGMTKRKRNMKKQAEFSRAYNAKSYDRLYPFVPKGHKSEIQAAADAAGESLNEFIVKAIDERIERMECVKSNRPWYQTEDAKAAIEQLRNDNANSSKDKPKK